jgi:hypothetical protein
MLGPLLIVEHLAHVPVMLLIVHELESLLLDLDGMLFLLGLHLSWVEEFIRLIFLVLGQETDGHMILNVPFVDALEK